MTETTALKGTKVETGKARNFKWQLKQSGDKMNYITNRNVLLVTFSFEKLMINIL